MSCKTFYWHYSYEISIFYNNIYWKINFYKKRSKNETLGYSFLSIFYWLCYYSCPIFSPLYSPLPCTFLPPVFSPLVHVHGSMGHTYKFFDFSISYTILNLTLSILYLPIMLISVLFPPLPSLLPHWLPSMWSPFLWFCSCSSCLLGLLLFLFWVWLLITVSFCHSYCSYFWSSFS